MRILKVVSTVAFLLGACYSVGAVKDASGGAGKSKESEIAILYGRWEGEIAFNYYEGVEKKSQEPSQFAIEITLNDRIKIFNKDKNKNWVEVPAGVINKFNILFDRHTIQGNFFDSGDDEDGHWVESQTFYFAYDENDCVLVYWVRFVNNTGIISGKPGSKWMTQSIGRLKKVVALKE